MGQGDDEQKQQGSVFKAYKNRGIIIKAKIYGDREEAGGVSATDVRREIGMIMKNNPNLLDGRVDSIEGLDMLLPMLTVSQERYPDDQVDIEDPDTTIRDQIKILVVKLIAHALLNNESTVQDINEKIATTIQNSTRTVATRPSGGGGMDGGRKRTTRKRKRKGTRKRKRKGTRKRKRKRERSKRKRSKKKNI